MTYFDSAYLAKFYLAEPETTAVRAKAEGDGDVACSVIGQAETLSVFHRKLREGALSPTEFAAVCDQFEADCVAGLWQWLDLTGEVLDELKARLRALPVTVFLRAADAIHLATAGKHGCREVYSNDRHLTTAAVHFGLRAITVPAVP